MLCKWNRTLTLPFRCVCNLLLPWDPSKSQYVLPEACSRLAIPQLFAHNWPEGHQADSSYEHLCTGFYVNISFCSSGINFQTCNCCVIGWLYVHLFFSNWSILTLQYSISFYCTTWISPKCTHTPSSLLCCHNLCHPLIPCSAPPHTGTLQAYSVTEKTAIQKPCRCSRCLL